jgi:hypothetical protein
MESLKALLSYNSKMLESRTPKIRVLVRKRPMNKKELSRGENDIVCIEKDQTVIVKEQK